MNKHVLYITNCYAKPTEPNVGAAARHYYTIEKLLDEKYYVDCITTEASTINQDTCEIQTLVDKDDSSNNLKIYNIYSSSMKKGTFFSRLLYYLSFFINAASKIKHLNKKYTYVIASVPTIFIGYLGLYQKFKYKTKLILDVRDLWTDSLRGTKYGNNWFLIFISQKLEKFLYEKADLIVCTTPSQAEIVKTITNNQVTVDVIMNGFDLDLLSNQKLLEVPEIINDIYKKYKYIILFTGKHSEYTDLFNIIEAAKDLKKDYAFLLVGGGYLKTNLVKKVKNEDISNVFFHEPVSKQKILNYMNSVDGLIINYSDSDAWANVIPNKLFDYMYWNKIIIAAVCSGEITNILSSASKDNIIIEPSNPKLLAKTLNKVNNFTLSGNKEYLMNNLLRDVQLNKFMQLMEEI